MVAPVTDDRNDIQIPLTDTNDCITTFTIKSQSKMKNKYLTNNYFNFTSHHLIEHQYIA